MKDVKSVSSTRRLATIAAAATALVAGCATSPPTVSDPTGRADADMLRVLTAFQASGAKPIANLSVEQARAQPTPGDAAAAVAQSMNAQPKASSGNKCSD